MAARLKVAAPAPPRHQVEPVSIRPATAADVQAMARLIQPFAERDLMLPRTPAYLFEMLQHFWVAEQGGELVGCVGLRPMGQDGSGRRLAELVSLAVPEDRQGSGLGRQLVETAIAAARGRGFQCVFTLTLVPDFFRRLGFTEVDNLLQQFPPKIWTECIYCPKQSHCDEVALWMDLEQ